MPFIFVIEARFFIRRINDPELRERYLKQFSLYDELPENIIGALALQIFQKGEYLCRQGEDPETFYLLLKGKLQVVHFQLDGSQAVFSFETPFSIIGDLELFYDIQVLGNVQALEDSLVFTAPARMIRDIGYDDACFLRFIIRHLAKKLHGSAGLLSQIPLSAEYRLARYLLYRMEKEGCVFQLEKRESLAAMLGTSVRHLNRTFRQLAALNAIEVQNKTLIITDPQVLIAVTEKGT